MGVLTGIYLFCFFVGLGWALIAIFLGEVFGDHDVDLGDHSVDFGGHDVDIGGHDVDIGGHEVDVGGHDVDAGGDTGFGAADTMHLSPFSPLIIATFLATFGGVGLIVGYSYPSLAGLTALPAAVTGLVLAAVVMVGFNKFAAEVEGGSEALSSRFVGLTALVITPIREGGMGEISFVARGSRFVGAARSADGKGLGRNTQVLITEVEGSTYTVEPLLRDEPENKAT
jgi:membrane protein implicated in regulation of membrane protease activity